MEEASVHTLQDLQTYEIMIENMYRKTLQNLNLQTKLVLLNHNPKYIF